MAMHFNALSLARQLRYAAGGVLLALSAQAACADVYVIMNASNPVRSLSRQEVSDLYLGRTRELPNGLAVTLFDQPNDQAARAEFFQLLVNMPLPQVNAYWARLSFTGRQTPPQTRADDAAVMAVISKSERAIGFVGTRPSDPSLRVVLHLKE